MSSHREAPETSKDPVADNTDVYAFISPDKPDTVTIIANFLPLQQPNGGPNFYEFGENVQYDIKISNRGRAGHADIVYRFEFNTKIRNRNTFLYNTGVIDDIRSEKWNRPQYYQVTRIHNGRKKVLGRGLRVPPVNVGPRSTPNYGNLAGQAVATIGSRKFFAGQRQDAFHVDLGSIFDLGGLRPLNQAHLIPLAKMDGINAVQSYNVHSIAMQVPISDLTRNGDAPKEVGLGSAVIGVWATASRRKSRVFNTNTGKYDSFGPYEQVSRLGNPLFNEVLVPMAEKDRWNHREPEDDRKYAVYVDRPELQKLLPFLYPGAFPRLAKYPGARKDLDAILLTGIPTGVVDGFQNYTGSNKADMVRLNVAVPPTPVGSAKYSIYGLAYGDAAGYPNGRRIQDDVVTIELQAIAGLTIPLVDKTFAPDDVVKAVTDGSPNTAKLLSTFPYLGTPGGGYETVNGTSSAS